MGILIKKEKAPAFTISLEDKPNLKRLQAADAETFREIVSTFVGLMEQAAELKDIPWYELPKQLNSNLTFKTTVNAIMQAFFDVKEIDKEDFDMFGAGVHPLSLLQSRATSSGKGTYSSWRKHFGLPDEMDVTPETVTKILRRLFYYAKYIDVEKLGAAMMVAQVEVHKALPMGNLERLPFVPALRYQQEHFGDLTVGKFWDEIGALYGGEMELNNSGAVECPACKAADLVIRSNHLICPSCNIGFKIKL